MQLAAAVPSQPARNVPAFKEAAPAYMGVDHVALSLTETVAEALRLWTATR